MPRLAFAALASLAFAAGASAQKGPDQAVASLPSFQDCPHCPDMVELPPGSFMMGALESEADSQSDERPQRQVFIPEGFAIGRYEVTFDEWDACVAAGGCTAISDEGWGRGRMPAINMTWDQAQAYVDWLSDEAGRVYRLPTEAEWEYAARAGTTTRFSMGDQITRNDANFDSVDGRSAPVGGYAPNPWGLHDMHGNVWEWVEDCYFGNETGYRGAPADGSAWIEGKCERRVYRGGGWATVEWGLRSAHRGSPTEPSRNWTGFRVVASLIPG